MRETLIVIFITLLFSSCIGPGQWQASRGMAAYSRQKYKKSAKRLEKARDKGYKAPGLHMALGLSYLYLGRYEEAVKSLTIAAEEAAKAWFEIGNAYYNSDKYDKAAEAYRRAISLKPDYLEAIEALAMLYPDGGVTKEEALKLWKRALELETRDEWITRAKHYIETLESQQ